MKSFFFEEGFPLKTKFFIIFSIWIKLHYILLTFISGGWLFSTSWRQSSFWRQLQSHFFRVSVSMVDMDLCAVAAFCSKGRFWLRRNINLGAFPLLKFHQSQAPVWMCLHPPECCFFSGCCRMSFTTEGKNISSVITFGLKGWEPVALNEEVIFPIVHDLTKTFAYNSTTSDVKYVSQGSPPLSVPNIPRQTFWKYWLITCTFFKWLHRNLPCALWRIHTFPKICNVSFNLFVTKSKQKRHWPHFCTKNQ